jgi:Undecaprenyl-phosphate galactose phosphotransferase WbaP
VSLPEPKQQPIETEPVPGDQSSSAQDRHLGPWLSFEWRRVLAATILAITDWLAVCGCVGLAWGLRTGPMHAAWPVLDEPYPFRTYLENLYYLAPWILAFAEAGLYQQRVQFWDEVRLVIRACSLAALFAIFLSYAVRPAEELSRLVIALTWMASLVVVPVGRHYVKLFLVSAGLWEKKVLILGAGETGLRVLEGIMQSRALGYRPVAFADDDPARIGRRHGDLPVHGPIASVPRLVRELGVKDLIIAMPRLPRERLLHVLSICEGHVESIRLVPDMFGVATLGVETQSIEGLLLLHLRWNLAKPWNIALKRSFDLLVAATGLFLLSPLIVLTVVAIRLDSPGPVFFWQDRLGRGWRRFECAKFRSMYVDSEQRLREHLAKDPEARAEWQRYAKLKSFDPRVTRVGRILRRLSLDELPQFWNVVRGEMSLVGPRPYMPREIEKMGDFAETILKAPPGVTGLWQVSGRNELPFEQRLRLDEYYVRNWSLWLDVMVLAKTGGVVLRGEGAY